uniref:Transthyretin-like family protein n=1 Tax=Strongyloides venezuelensis TaxID=75913 RepID=A0A0K0F8K8_STRVS
MIIHTTDSISIEVEKRVIIAGRVSCNFESSRDIDIQLWEIEKTLLNDVEFKTTTDLDGNFYMDTTVKDYFTDDLELVVKIFHQCNVKDATICYNVVEILIPTIFFNQKKDSEESYTPTAYNLGTIELNTNHPIQRRSCSHILGSTINRYIEFGLKFLS